MDNLMVEGRAHVHGVTVPVSGAAAIRAELLSQRTVEWLRLLPCGLALTGDVPDKYYTGSTFAGRELLPPGGRALVQDWAKPLCPVASARRPSEGSGRPVVLSGGPPADSGSTNMLGI